MSEFYVKFLGFFDIVSAKHGTENGTGLINMLGMKFGFLFPNSEISNPCRFPYCDYSTTQVSSLGGYKWETLEEIILNGM